MAVKWPQKGEVAAVGPAVGVDESYYAIRAAGTVLIPTAGPWTFGVNSDDGFELVLERNGQILRSDYEGLRGPDNTLATFDIPEAGDWSIRLISFENVVDFEEPRVRVFDVACLREEFAARVRQVAEPNTAKVTRHLLAHPLREDERVADEGQHPSGRRDLCLPIGR